MPEFKGITSQTGPFEIQAKASDSSSSLLVLKNSAGTVVSSIDNAGTISGVTSSNPSTQDLLITGLGLKGMAGDPSVYQSFSQKNNAYLHGHACYLLAGTTITYLSMFWGGAGSGVTHCRYGIYNSSYAKVAESADTPGIAAQGWRELALSSPYVVPSNGVYYLTELIVASTMPDILGNFSDLRSGAGSGSGSQTGRGGMPGGAYLWWFDPNVAGGGTGYTSGAMPSTAVPQASSSDHCMLAR